MSIIRFRVSFEKELLKALDKYASNNHFTRCPQVILNLINKNIVTNKWQCNNIVTDSITLVYNYHKKDLLANITDLQCTKHTMSKAN